MPSVPYIFLTDSPSHQQWFVSCDNNAVLQTVPVSGQNAVPYINLNSVTDGTSWQLTVIANPPPTGLNWGQLQTTSIPQGSYPTQALVTAPNGTAYAVQVATVGPPTLGSTANGILQTALPVDTSLLTCTTPISTLAANVLARLEENYTSGVDTGPVFWNKNFEVYTAVVEAMNDLLLLVGRPTQTVGLQFNLTPNSVWQYLPKGLFLISDVWGPQSRLRKGTLFDLDYNQSSWGSDWENDTSPSGPTLWCPCGFNIFIVHPAPTAPQTVLLDGIAYPVAETAFPYSGSETVPFHHEAFGWIEQYAAHYARIKEGSQEFQESLILYQNYLQGAKRMTEIEDRRDPLVFSPSFGAPAGVQSHVKR